MKNELVEIDVVPVKIGNVVIVPLREDLPIGTQFKYMRGRNIYEIKEAPDGRINCDCCALNSRKRRRECASLFCMPATRADKKTVYAVKVK